MSEPTIRHRVNRPAPTARWECEHRWGTSLGDSTTLSVSRTGGLGMTISYGKEKVEIRAEIVTVFAEMVAAAAVWVDGADQ